MILPTLLVLLVILTVGLAGIVVRMIAVDGNGVDSPWKAIQSLAEWTRRAWGIALTTVGAYLTRKGMNHLMREESFLSSSKGDPFDDFVTRYLEKHG